MRASGTAGVLRVGYQVAADLGEWHMVLAPRLPLTYAFRASVLSEHDYWITQEPLDLVVQIGTAEWLWRGVEVRREGDTVTIDLHERPIVSVRAAMERSQ